MSSPQPLELPKGCTCNLHAVCGPGLCLFSIHFTPSNYYTSWKPALVIECNLNPQPACRTRKSAGKLFVITSSTSVRLQCCATKLNFTLHAAIYHVLQDFLFFTLAEKTKEKVGGKCLLLHSVIVLIRHHQELYLSIPLLQLKANRIFQLYMISWRVQ